MLLTAAGLAVGAYACASHQDALVLLEVRLPDDTPTLKALRFSVKDHPEIPRRTLAGDQRPPLVRVGYYLPAVGGSLIVLAEAIDPDDCVVANGTVRVESVSSGQPTNPITLQLEKLGTRDCTGMIGGLGGTDGGDGGDVVGEGTGGGGGMVVGGGTGGIAGVDGGAGGMEGGPDGTGGIAAVDSGTSDLPSDSADVPATSCGASEMKCSSGCSNLRTDRLNCGACDRKCLGDQGCSGSMCGCATGTVACPNDPLKCVTDVALCCAPGYAVCGQSCCKVDSGLDRPSDMTTS
jgi:hypothetical protein